MPAPSPWGSLSEMPMPPDRKASSSGGHAGCSQALLAEVRRASTPHPALLCLPPAREGTTSSPSRTWARVKAVTGSPTGPCRAGVTPPEPNLAGLIW